MEIGGSDPFVSSVKKASVHFAKAAIEIFAGIGTLASGVSRSVRPDPSDDSLPDPDAPVRIDIE